MSSEEEININQIPKEEFYNNNINEQSDDYYKFNRNRKITIGGIQLLKYDNNNNNDNSKLRKGSENFTLIKDLKLKKYQSNFTK